MKKLRWGILSTAKIARTKMIPALQASPFNEVIAVGSRNADRAAQFAADCDIPTSYGSYEELLANPDIDAIYNPLPNHLHVPLSVQALQAGKHVLCEKPLGLDGKEVSYLIDCAAEYPKQLLMEAFMYRFHPQWLQVLKMIEDGVLGTVKSVQSNFTFFNDDPDNVRNQPGIGGGSLMDVGCYCISLARTLFGREPARVVAQMDMDERFQVDRHTSGIMDFQPGLSTFYSSTQSAPSQWVHIIGELATLTMDAPFYEGPSAGSLVLKQGDQEHIIPVESANHFVEEVNAFAQAALNGDQSPRPLTDALANMRVIDAMMESAKTSTWTDVSIQT